MSSADEVPGPEAEVDQLVQELMDCFPGLRPKQYKVLAAMTEHPTIYGAARVAGVSNVTVYTWLGRVTGQPSGYSPAFEQASKFCMMMGRESVIRDGINMARSYARDGKAVAPLLMRKCMEAWDEDFKPNSHVTVDKTVKRIILDDAQPSA